MAPFDGKQALCDLSAQLQHEGIFFVAVYQALLQSRRHAHDAGNIFGSGALTFFLRAALQQALGPEPVFHIQESAAFRTVEFMCRDRQEIRLQLCQVDFHMPCCLHCIRMKPHAVHPADRRKLFYRLNRADFIVGIHHAHQRCIRADRSFQRFGQNQPFRRYWQIRHPKPLPFQRLRRV